MAVMADLSKMVSKNNMVPNDHLRKDWYKRVKTYFDDPARAQRRRNARIALGKKIAPRPVEGPLRPLVHCPTVRYNAKLRLGRGFTKEELKAAGIDSARARYLGIAVDTRREHCKDKELLKQNIDRLVAYKSRVVRVPKGETLPQVSEPSLFAVPKVQQQVKWCVIKSEDSKKEMFKEKQDKMKAYRNSIKEKKAEKYKK